MSPEDERVFAYTKLYDREMIIVLANFTQKEVSYGPLPKYGQLNDSIGNYSSAGKIPSGGDSQIRLRPWEALVLAVTVDS